VLHHAEASLQQLIILVSLFNGFVQFFKSFAVFVAVHYFWQEKFTQQEAFTIPEHSRHCFFADGSVLNFFVWMNKDVSVMEFFFLIWGELVNPCFISHKDAFHERFSFMLVMAKIFKQGSHSFAFMLLGEHFRNPMSRRFTEV
jgi:hypothetical protein